MSVIDLDQRRPDSPAGGVGFDPSCYDLEIVGARQYQTPEQLEEGQLWFDEWHVLDNETGVVTRYRETTGIPNHQSTDISIAIGTPWLTSERGHNERTLLRYMGVGIPGRLIGPPRIWVPGNSLKSSIEGTVEASKHVELGKDALAFMMIMIAQDELGPNRRLLQAGESHYHGESRAAMFGFALLSLAEEMGWKLHVPELIDPCLAEETTAADLAKLENLKKISNEVTTFIQLAAGIMVEKRRRHYRKTLDTSLEYLIPAAATWNALSNGQSGAMAAKTPQESSVNVTFCSGSVANQEAVYRAILANHLGIEYFEQNGGHLALARRNALFASIGRVIEANRQLEEGGAISNIHAIRQAVPLVA